MRQFLSAPILAFLKKKINVGSGIVLVFGARDWYHGCNEKSGFVR
jgi:hypothetical protein